MDKETAFVAFAKGGERAVESKRRMIAILRHYGVMNLTSLAKETGISISGAFKYVRHLEDAGIVITEKENGKRFIKISDIAATEWALDSLPESSQNADIMSAVREYLDSVSRKWNQITVKEGNRERSLREYLPVFLTTRVYPIGLGPLDVIKLIGIVEHQTRKEITSYELERMIEQGLESINPDFTRKFKALTLDVETKRSIEEASKKYVTSRSFHGPDLKSLRKLISSG